MKKEDIIGTIVYLLLVAFAAVFFFTVIRGYAPSSGLGDAYLWLVVLAFIVGIVFNAILFELAHMLGAKIGRYKIVSVCILGLTFGKVEGKLKVGFASFDGLTGETKIIPLENTKKEPNPYPYLLFGTLFFVIEVIAIMIVFSIFHNELGGMGNFVYCLLTAGVAGLLIFLYNILPFQLDSMTDGYRLTLVTNPKNRAAFNELLRVEYDLANGINVEIKTFKEITNFTADLNLNKVYLMMDEKKFSEAEELLDGIINAKSNLSYSVYIRAKAQKIYINLINKSIEEAAEFYDKNVPVSERRDIADDASMPCIRAYLLMSGILDKSRSECVIALNKVPSAYKKTPEKRKKIEAALFNDSLKMVCDAHPKWELDKYYLKTEDKK